MKKYDLIFYFTGVHVSYFYKYINLAQKLKNRFKSLVVLNCDHNNSCKPPPIDQIKSFYSNNLDMIDNIVLLKHQQFLKALDDIDFKLLVFDSYHVGKQSGVKIDSAINKAKHKGAITMQISDQGLDFRGNSKIDIASLITPYYNPTKFYQKYIKTYKHIIYSGCLTWDSVVDLNHENITRNQYCKFYNLNPAKPIVCWAPGNVWRSIGSVGSHDNGYGADVYREVTKIDNLIIKPHPSEIRRKDSHVFNGGWSYENLSSKKTAILKPEHTYLWFKFADCIISYNSSIHHDALMHNTPTVYINSQHSYVDLDGKKTKIACFHDSEGWNKTFKFAGYSCDLEDIHDFIENKNYVLDQHVFDNLKIEMGLDKNFIDTFFEQISEIIN